MSRGMYTECSAAAIDYQVVTQFARLLRLQAQILEEDGDKREAAALRARAARSERDLARPSRLH